MGRIRSRLTYANVVATLALFLVLGGSTALASYVISSNSQVGPGTISGHKPPTGKHANIIPGTLNSFDVADNSLTGADIRSRSGVDTCEPPFTARYGRICAARMARPGTGRGPSTTAPTGGCASRPPRRRSLSPSTTTCRGSMAPSGSGRKRRSSYQATTLRERWPTTVAKHS